MTRDAAMHGLAGLFGVASYACSHFCGRMVQTVGLAEWAWLLMWVSVSCGAAAMCGRITPSRSVRWAAVIVGIQPVCAFVQAWSTGELRHPTSSTGGLVAVGGFAFMALCVSPLVLLASRVGARWNR